MLRANFRGPVALLPTRAACLVACLAAALVPACNGGGAPAGLDPDGARRGSVQQAILGGTTSDASQDAVVMLVLIDPATNRRVDLCTATMVAPKLLITARHCLSITSSQVACDADGTPLVGGEVAGNHEPTNFYVFTGPNRPELTGDIGVPLDTTKWKPAGQGAQIIDDHSGTLCNHDVALLLLKDPIPNTPLATMRLDSDAVAGEPLLTVGWGVSSDEVEPKQRRQRSGDISVERVGPDPSVPVLTKSEFLFGESICLGDSGGPIYSTKTNAIIGVVSRGGNGSNGTDPSSTCTQAENIGTKLSPFKELITTAFQSAGATPLVEPAPKPSDSGCAVARAGTTGRTETPILGVLGAGVIALGARRRRRRA